MITRAYLTLGTCSAVAAGRPWTANGSPRYFGTWIFSGRVDGAVITGASRGIGLAIARGLALEGAVVSICARDPGGLSEAVDRLGREG